MLEEPKAETLTNEPFRLSAEQMETAKRLIQDKCKALFTAGQGCPACRQTSWALEPFLAEISSHGFGNALAPGKAWPCLLLTCKNCFLHLPVNAILIGVLPQEVAVKKANPETKEGA